MNKIIVSLLVAAAMLLTPQSKAQGSLFGPIPILGTSNGPVAVTNTFNFPVKQMTLALSGMTNSATVFTGTVALSLDGTNFVTAGTINNSGSNNWSTNIAAYTWPLPVYLWLQAKTGTNTIWISATYGP
jgi:hypothetical protein